jgi:choline monooxygenase
VWHYVGHVGQLAKPGDFFTTRLDRVPVVVVRDETGALRGHVNVCRHRGCEVVHDASGNRRSLQCPYHAWTYALDGRLLAAPKAKDQPGFDPAECSLPPVQIEQWGPLIFANLSGAARTLAEQFEVLPSLVTDAGIDFASVSFRRHDVHNVNANWKVVVENYLECYHCSVVHPSFIKTTNLEEFRIVPYGNVITEVVPTKEEYLPRVADGPVVNQGCYSYVWPLFILNIFPGKTSAFVRQLIPVAVDKTQVVYDFFYADEVSAEEEEELWQTGDQIFREDIPMVESVQRGLSSGTLEVGRLFLTEEVGPQYFKKLVLKALTREHEG